MAVVSWQEILASAAGVVSAIGVIAGLLWFLVGPRVRESLKTFTSGLLAPIHNDISQLRNENTEQHAENGRRADEFSERVEVRWQAHEELHREIAADVGEVKGLIGGLSRE